MIDEIVEALKDDTLYYGEYGGKYLSNSDIGTLLNEPENFRKKVFKKSSALLIGGYFHTAILEPEKLINYKVIDAKNRHAKHYKNESEGVLCLLQHEVDKINQMCDIVLSNEDCYDLIRNGDVEYEQPNIREIAGEIWKGKADILNHTADAIIDLKTTSNLVDFKDSAKKFNYDSQAYIYGTLFNKDFQFICIDKRSMQLGKFDCSQEFLDRGRVKVEKAVEAFRKLKGGNTL